LLSIDNCIDYQEENNNSAEVNTYLSNMKFEAVLSILVQLNDGELNLLRPLIKTETVEKGAYYIRAGQRCNKVSFINEGLFKMAVIDSAGNEKIIEFPGTSEFVTDYISFLNRTPTDCDIIALQTSILESISYQDLQKIYEHSPRFQKAGRLLAEQNFIKLGGRIKSQSLPPHERYKLLCENSYLIQHVPQYMIASYLGVSAEWLSKIRSKK
jgi:CRP-like cAMP-binding protein